MPFLIIRDDITHVACDAIVNAANESLLGGGGVDGAIHRAAGPQLLEECRTLGGCKTGMAKRTLAYRLPARYVIHTVGPIWRGGGYGEEALLRSCYRQSLQLAQESGCESVAFPLISAGAYGYPADQALRVARESILEFLETHDLTVYLVVFQKKAFQLSRELQTEIASFIDDAYAARFDDAQSRRWAHNQLYAGTANAAPKPEKAQKRPLVFRPKKQPGAAKEETIQEACPIQAAPFGDLWDEEPGLKRALNELDESFSQMLLRKIDEKGMTDAACYKKANIDRKLFSKIRKDVHYKPSKPTVLALAIALELPLEETEELLGKAGFAFSHSYRFDLIIEFFIRKGIYDVFRINEALFAYDQPLLGA